MMDHSTAPHQSSPSTKKCDTCMKFIIIYNKRQNRTVTGRGGGRAFSAAFTPLAKMLCGGVYLAVLTVKGPGGNGDRDVSTIGN